MEKYLIGHGTLGASFRCLAYIGVCVFLVICLDFATSGGETESIPVRDIYTGVVDKAIGANRDPHLREGGSPKLQKLNDSATQEKQVGELTDSKEVESDMEEPKEVPKDSEPNSSKPSTEKTEAIVQHDDVNKTSESAQTAQTAAEAVNTTLKSPPMASSEGNAPADCVKLKFGKNLPLVAATGFPGSGNTWVGHLIQQSTGIYVGSAYCADYMLELGFRGECRHDDTVAVIRTHRMCHHMCCEDEVINVNYSKAVVLIRNPYDALRSEFNRRGGGRTGHAPLEMWKTEWPDFVTKMAPNWKTHIFMWLENFKGPIMILRYEELRRNLRSEIQRLTRFLGFHLTDQHLNCVIKNAVGGFKRGKGQVLTYDPFTQEMKKEIDGYMRDVDDMIDRYWKYRGKYIRRESCPWQ